MCLWSISSSLKFDVQSFAGFREVYVDADTGVPYDIVMSKVDVKYGYYGLNNFYKMQVRVNILPCYSL